MKKRSIIAELQGLPLPDEDALKQSQKLSELISAEIDANKGHIGFDRFMHMALFHPGLGYYSAGARKFGRDGDFTTAPETSMLFSMCIARQCEQVFNLTGASVVLELGAGTGNMACDILTELQRRDSLPDQYLILETSADLRQRQQLLLQQRHYDIYDRLVWLDTLPDKPLNGIIVANEVIDAIPVHRICVLNNQVHELRVASDGSSFQWHRPANELMQEVMLQLPGDLVQALPEGYRSEFNTLLAPYIKALSASLGSGVLLLVDYGYARHEYYHPQRSDGTLACYYRHRRHSNPFIYPGLQDITASVDFTLVAESAHASGLDIYGFTTQAGFLISCGLEKILTEISGGNDSVSLHHAQQAGKLLMPDEMGETFKVMMLGRNINQPLLGAGYGSHLHRL